jgi:hypothetical protein
MQVRQWFSQKDWPVRVGGVFFAGCLGLVLSNRASPPEPRLVCQSPSVDLGVIRSDEPRDSLFVIRNGGRAVLRISGVTASCACTVVPFFQRDLQPGASTVIPVRLDVKGRRGAVTQYVLLTTNDPAHSQFPLRLTADVEIASSVTALGASP